MKLQQKTILITGASSGIGRAVAITLGQRGNRLIVTARRKALLDSLSAEIIAAGGHCLAIAADALDPKQASTVVSQAIEQFGTIDAALLNVGDGPLLDMRTEQAVAVTDNMRLNYDTLVHFLVPLIEQMKRQDHGLIAHTNSLAGFLGLPQQGPYSAAKSACRILMDTCRIELASYNIRFVSVHPGFIATERVAGDGIPAPMEISEQAAAKHIIYAMEKEKRDYLFPFPMLLVDPIVANVAQTNRRIHHRPDDGQRMTKRICNDFVTIASEISPALADAIDTIGPIRLQKRNDQPLVDVLFRAIAGQQLSTKAAASIWSRLTENAADESLIEFIANSDPDQIRSCGLSNAKVKSMKAIVAAHSDGRLEQQTLSRLDHVERSERLTTIWGVGQWTADMMGIFYFGDRDVWPDTDLAVWKTLERLTS